MKIELWPDTIKVVDETGEHHISPRGSGYDVIRALVEEVMAYRNAKPAVDRLMRQGVDAMDAINGILSVGGNKTVDTYRHSKTFQNFEAIQPSMGIDRIKVERSFNWTRTYYLDQHCPECGTSGDDGYGHRCSECCGRGVRMESIAEENPIKIVINGKEHRILRDNLTFEEIAELAGFFKGGTPTVTYRGDKDGDSGILTPERGSNWIGICEGMIFNVANTGNA